MGIRVGMKFKAVVVSAILLASTSPLVAFADTAISQGFSSDEKLVAGVIVSSQADDNKSIQRASNVSSDRMLGVVSKESLIELSSGKNQVQVVTSGSSPVLVSDLNGSIEVGDKITASPIRGVGMKAINNGYVIGTAQSGWNEATEVTTQEVEQKNGISKSVKVGMIPVQINVSYYQQSDSDKSVLPAFLLNLARNIAGHEVSVLRVVVVLIILVVGVGAIGALLYSSVRSSIISIGRNPLAASAVNKSLAKVILLAIAVLLVMLVGVYLVLVI